MVLWVVLAAFIAVRKSKPSAAVSESCQPIGSNAGLSAPFDHAVCVSDLHTPANSNQREKRGLEYVSGMHGGPREFDIPSPVAGTCNSAPWRS
jgi:hypothetical protein